MNSGEEADTIYANDDITKVANISKLLQTRNIDQILEQDKTEIERLDENVQWYHKKIPRDTAEQLLKEGTYILYLLVHWTMSMNTIILQM